jgi:hypothetical protein
MKFGYFFLSEKHLTDCFYEILLNSTIQHHVVDVGGNIGWFTLLSRSVGASVDVFEPNPSNIKRFAGIPHSKWMGLLFGLLVCRQGAYSSRWRLLS